MAQPQELFYAAVGIGDLAIEKARNVSVPDAKSTQKMYNDFVKRGKTLSTRIRNSAPTKQAVAQTKTARSQVKAAATSVTKTVQTSATGPRSQARKQAKTARTQVKAAATSVTKAAQAGAKATRSAASKVAQVS